MTKTQAFPDFFIIGGPRCGTTALWTYLSTHPSIFMPELKEPKYFCTDLGHRIVQSETEYRALFRNKKTAHLAVGEASASYAYSTQAVPNILQKNPEAKFILMVRNPIEMAQSLHQHLVYLNVEDEKDFETAWYLQDKRRGGEHVPKTCNDPKRLLYGDICRLGYQLRRISQRVRRDQLLVILQSEFRSNPVVTYKNVLSFLGVEYDGRVNFLYVNEQREIKSGFIAACMAGFGRVQKRMPVRFKLGIMNRLNDWNSNRIERKTLSDELLSEMRAFYREDIGILSEQLKLDLSFWLR